MPWKIIVFILLIIALFVLALTIGFGVDRDDGSAAQKRWSEALRSRVEVWFGVRSLGRQDFSPRSDCRPRDERGELIFALDEDDACELVIVASTTRIRRGELQLIQGKVEVEFEPEPASDGEPRPIPASRELSLLPDAQKKLPLTVFPEGGTLSIDCQGSAPCKLRLQ